MRIPRSTLLAVACLLIAAAPASAVVTPGSAGGNQVSLTSDGAGDSMSLSCVAGMARGAGVDILPCANVTTLFVQGNGGNDAITLTDVTAAAFPLLDRVEIDGGAGTDTVRATQVADTITGDSEDVIFSAAGDDVVTANGGSVFGEDGNDLIRLAGSGDGGSGDDRFVSPSGTGPYAGGTGEDDFAIDYSTLPALDVALTLTDSSVSVGAPSLPAINVPVTSMEHASLTTPIGGTHIIDGSGYSGSLTARGGEGTDTITGGTGEDFLFGAGGSDTITGGPGFDYVNAGAGADSLLLRDGAIDRGACGEGADTVVADTADALSDCETADVPAPPPPTVITNTVTVQVTTPAPPPPPADTTAPKLTINAAKISGRRLSLVVACPKDETRCSGSVTLGATGKRKGKAAKASLGTVTLAVAGGKAQTLTRTLTAAQLTTLRAFTGAKLSVVAAVKDAAGNAATQKASLALKVPRR